MGDSGSLQSNDGAYTVRNSMAAGSVLLPRSAKTLTYADGTLVTASLFCGGENMTSVTYQSYKHDFTQVTDPGTVETWYSPKPHGEFLKPVPPDADWTLTYEINAPGNMMNDIKGTVPIARHQDTVIEFRYQVDEDNGAAWYEMAVWYTDTIGIYPHGIDPPPSVVTQIGNTPAVHVS